MDSNIALEICEKIDTATPPTWLNAFARSHRGKVRGENQDRFVLAYDPKADMVVAIVADGMGGHTGGSQAAEIATVTMKANLLETPQPFYQRLHTSFVKADEAIRERASRELQLSGMGTTGVAAIVSEGKCTHLYTGDSRLYHFRNGAEIYRTKDHSVVRYLEEEGLLTAEEARNHPMRSRLTSSLGGGPQERKLILEPKWQDDGSPQPAELEMAPGDLVLICSDGLCGEVNQDKLLELVAEHGGSPEELTKRCVEAALDAGGRDNITVIVLQVPA